MNKLTMIVMGGVLVALLVIASLPNAPTVENAPHVAALSTALQKSKTQQFMEAMAKGHYSIYSDPAGEVYNGVPRESAYSTVMFTWAGGGFLGRGNTVKEAEADMLRDAGKTFARLAKEEGETPSR